MWAHGYYCATIGKITENTTSAYIEQQDTPSEPDNFTLDGE